jgi:SHS2 domain-containing protein
MKKFEILEHRTDLKIKALGKTKEELFLNILLGMTEFQKPEVEKGKEVKREIKIESVDFPALLVDFLNEVLYLDQTQKEAYFGLNFKKLGEKTLEVELIGQKVKRFGEDIKAATFHGLDVRKDKNWQATVLFDI